MLAAVDLVRWWLTAVAALVIGGPWMVQLGLVVGEGVV